MAGIRPWCIALQAGEKAVPGHAGQGLSGAVRPARISGTLFRVLSSTAILYIIRRLFSEECRTPDAAAQTVF